MNFLSLTSVTLLFLLYSSTQASSLRGTAPTNLVEVHKNYKSIIVQSELQICYGVMFDAGSSGTRVYVYNWPCREMQTISSINIKQISPQQKVSPGLSSKAGNLSDIKPYLEPLIQYAKQIVPQSQWAFTPILLGATAGMRILDHQQQNNIMLIVRSIFETSGFLFLQPEWARVISGQEEGSYMWLSVNYLLSQIDSNPTPTQTSVTIDLGGASTQIAFKPQVLSINSSQNTDLVIPNFNEYDIYSISYLGYGNDMARNYIIGQSLQQGSNTIYSPCFHKDFQTQWDSDKTKTIIGTGDFQMCQAMIKQLLNNDQNTCPFPDYQCSINHTFEPLLDPSIQIYGINGIETASSFLGLDQFKLSELLQSSQDFCSLTWEQVQLNPIWKGDSFVSTDFFLVIYAYELLNTGYRVPQDVIIQAPSKIQNNTPSWTLAGMFYQIAQIECQYDSPICTTENFKSTIFGSLIR